MGGRALVGFVLVVGGVVAPASVALGAPPDDDELTDAGAGAAAVDIVSNEGTIDLDLLGATEGVQPPAGNGTNTSTEGLEVVYNDSSFAAEAAEVSATRSDLGLTASAGVGGTTLSLLGQTLVTVGSASAAVECLNDGQAAATAGAIDVDLGLGPESLGANELTDAIVDFEAAEFTPGTATAYLTAETATIVDDGFAVAIGLAVTVTIDGEPAGSGAGVVEDAITGFVVLAGASCLVLADSGTDAISFTLFAGVILVAGGVLLRRWSRRELLLLG